MRITIRKIVEMGEQRIEKEVVAEYTEPCGDQINTLAEVIQTILANIGEEK